MANTSSCEVSTSIIHDNKEILDDYSDPVCAVCKISGEMICCDGRCYRSFHPKCIGLHEEDIPEDEPFVCSDCYCGIQRCFACCEFGIESELIKCSVSHCGKFYHSNCVSVSSDCNDFVCKLHVCDTCGDRVVDSTKRSTLWRCFRCPKAYDIKHRPRDVHVLAEGLFLCIKHTQEEEIWPEISKDILERLEKKNGLASNQPASVTRASLSLPGMGNSWLPSEEEEEASGHLSADIQRLGSARTAQRLAAEEYLERQRAARAEKERLDKESDIRASDIVPMKRQVPRQQDYSGDVGNDFSSIHKQSPASWKSQAMSSSPSFNLKRHNEARRRRRFDWSTDLQNQEIEMRHRAPPLGYRMPEGMSRTDALLGALRNAGPSVGASGGGLMRTTALLSHLFSAPSEPAFKRHRTESFPVQPAFAPFAGRGPPPTHQVRHAVHNAPLSRTEQLLASVSAPPPRLSPPHNYIGAGVKGEPFHNFGGGRGLSCDPHHMGHMPERNGMGNMASHRGGFHGGVIHNGHGHFGNQQGQKITASSLNSRPNPTGEMRKSQHNGAPVKPQSNGAYGRPQTNGSPVKYQSNSAPAKPQPNGAPVKPQPSSKDKDKMDATDLYAMLMATGLLPK